MALTLDQPRQPSRFGVETAASAAPLDAFCARVLADVALQERLREADDVEGFADLVMTSARDCGFDLSADSIRQRMQGRTLGLDAAFGASLRETPLPPAGFLPVRAVWQEDGLYLHWSYFGSAPLREPFFEGEVRRRGTRPFNRLFGHATPISRSPEWLTRHPGLSPSGFIFHMSRCGSTLVAQMLAASADHVVVSEAAPIDTAVRARHVRPDLEMDEQARWLGWIIGALGQPRRGGERRYFVKLDSWHTSALPLFRRAFPSVPWIFLYRDPVEVMVSQLTEPGVQMIPGALDAGRPDRGEAHSRRSREEHVARVLATICEPILGHWSDGGGLLVNYCELPGALWTRILPHFGLWCTEDDRAAMAKTARLDAKTPALAFAPDSASKQQAATARCRAAAEEWLGGLYRRLEALRLNGTRSA
jgi:hypothetical protein